MSNTESRGTGLSAGNDKAGSLRNQNKRRRHQRNQGRNRTKVCGNKNMQDPRNIIISRDEMKRLLVSDQASLDAALEGYPDTDKPIAVQGGTPQKPLVIRYKSRVPPVVLSGSYVVVRGDARAGVYGEGSIVIGLENARLNVHAQNHAVIFDEVKAEVCGTSSVCAYDHSHVTLFHEAVGEIHGRARCRCKQKTSADAYDEAVLRLTDDALGVRRSEKAHLLEVGGKPYFDELGTAPKVILNDLQPPDSGPPAS